MILYRLPSGTLLTQRCQASVGTWQAGTPLERPLVVFRPPVRGMPGDRPSSQVVATAGPDRTGQAEGLPRPRKDLHTPAQPGTETPPRRTTASGPNQQYSLHARPCPPDQTNGVLPPTIATALEPSCKLVAPSIVQSN